MKQISRRDLSEFQRALQKAELINAEDARGHPDASMKRIFVLIGKLIQDPLDSEDCDLILKILDDAKRVGSKRAPANELHSVYFQVRQLVRVEGVKALTSNRHDDGAFAIAASRTGKKEGTVRRMYYESKRLFEKAGIHNLLI